MRSQALLEELKWRDLLFQATEQAGAALDRGPVTGYAGFDPTAPSLHVGSLVPVMGLVHLQRAGHRPIALVGGGTGLIGDPSGKASERPLSDATVVAANTASIRAQLERFLDFSGPSAARMVDNAEWLVDLRAIDFMRDVGKHFTVNYMLQKESVKGRMDAGISFTEFSYMLLQAYDFLELHRRHGVTLQVGGSDQWGNITAGIELIRRTVSAEAHGITFPLVTSATGTKFGKTESGAVWLDAKQTSPYKFYQFWINADDRDVGRYLRYFTLLSREEVEALDASAREHPEKREAQRALARDVTQRVHGTEAVRAAEEVSGLLFGGGDAASLSKSAVEALREEIPFFTASSLTEPQMVIDAVTSETGLFKSRGDAKRMIQQGGVYLNGARAGADLTSVTPLHGKYVLVRKGGKSYALVGI
ncbi:MAG TPA: tyrosine--tRNA ligase [Gemmatimonadaceae bacterium]|nr:tyrosine--tRNA ligase [Gemmatimonadaceae bacterium]